MGFIFALVLAVAAVTVLSIIRGFALSYLWHWFIAPLGVPELSISHAIGVSMIVAFLTYEDAKKENEGWEALAASLFQSVLVLGVGYIVHQVMVG